MRRYATGKRYAGAITVALALFYILFAYTSAGRDDYLEVLAPIQVPPVPAANLNIPDPRGDTHAFTGLTVAGYYSDTGSVISSGRRTQGLLLTEAYSVHTDPGTRTLTFSDRETGKSTSSSILGLPFSLGETMYAVRPDQQGISRITSGESSPAWSYEFGTPLSGASEADAYSAWGTIDGRVHIFDSSTGKLAWKIDPKTYGMDSLFACVYSVAISPAADALAVLYGLDPQYLLLLIRHDGGWALEYSRRMHSQVREARTAQFTNDGSALLMHTGEGLFNYTFSEKTGAFLHPQKFSRPGQFMVMEPWGENTIALLLAEGEKRNIAIITTDSLRAFFPVDADMAALSVLENTLVVSGDSSIQRFRSTDTSGDM